MNALRWVVSAAAFAACLASAEDIVVSPPLKGFVATKDYALRVDGAPAPATIYYQGEQPAYLVFSDKLPGAALLDVRAGVVETVGAGRIVRQKDGSLDVLPNARKRIGPFALSQKNVTFVFEKKKVELVRNQS